MPPGGYETKELMRVPIPFRREDATLYEAGIETRQLARIKLTSLGEEDNRESSYDDDPTPRTYIGHPKRRAA